MQRGRFEKRFLKYVKSREKCKQCIYDEYCADFPSHCGQFAPWGDHFNPFIKKTRGIEK